MWVEILVVLAAIASILSFFGLPARRIAQLMKQHITRTRSLFSVAIIVTVGTLYVQVLSILYLRPIGWGLAALVLWFCFLVWQPIIDARFSSKMVLRRAMSTIASFGSIPVLLVIFITWDVPVWRRVVFIGGGFVLGLVVSIIEGYIRRRRAVEREGSHKQKRQSL